ncbi:starch phosphorylase [Flexibacter flexilis DSM 6793]|uniref:Starch phosphorylase n=1 Tax=Flexibacter flexilis DSM 6793 TaxID=927664 RepID=A0A1I1EA47_9BACT|nr:alpha-glucan family phosphorylase [Flexibacter flexilis]SFB82218.1 starch phosphorylase [Flexibacter flexilis DSM 6793]
MDANKLHPYPINPKYSKRVAYFSMEYAIDQALKTYSGGLGFLAGSHMHSAYDLKQNVIGIGILWKFGYYDQVRNADNSMGVLFQEKIYSFLEDSGIMVPVYINKHQVYVKALYLPPHVFGTAPLFFLTTDIPENDYLAQTITYKLYDADTAARIAQNIVLGIGGAKVIEALGGAEIYHMNEAHALPLIFHLYNQLGQSSDAIRQKLVFTTHTPEKAGNEEHDIFLLDKMGFFGSLSLDEARAITGENGQMFNHSLVALRFAKVANGVSQLHGRVSREMWKNYVGVCEIKAITNSQNSTYWSDKAMNEALADGDDDRLKHRKKHLKKRLIQLIADQTGKMFDKDAIIIVWARRFAEYKRADLIKRDITRFNKLISQTDKKVQIVWAGKPYPSDYNAISLFNHLVQSSKHLPNCAVLTGYELGLSSLLKKGADVWLNTPRRPREASGTSGMSAAMNGAVNLTISDGWIPEFARHGENAFVLPIADTRQPIDQQDNFDNQNLMDMLENDILPLYYDKPDQWFEIVKNSMRDVMPYFDSARMADEYYELYNQ